MAEKSEYDGLIVRKKDLKLIDCRSGGRRADVAAPWIGSPVRTMQVFFREIPPGGKTGVHRHRNEAVIHILSGHGYTTVEDQRVDWEAGDTLCVPIWAWHDNVNSSDSEPATFLAAINRPLMEALNIWAIEDPDPTAAKTYFRHREQNGEQK